MAFDPSPETRNDEQSTRILQVLENVATRRISGEDLPDDYVIQANPELMPDLGTKLQALRLTEQARQVAVDSGTVGWESASESPEGAYTDDLLPARTFRGYKIEAEIGRGAMGVVYQALQTATNRQVAIKVMVEGPFAGMHDRIRFQREARILGQLKHSNIVTIHDSGVTAGRFFMVMDHVEGPTLDTYLADEAFSVRRKIDVFATVCDAVHAAHLRGIIHRDLKPSNIRVDADGEPQVLDFGLAKMVPDAAQAEISDRSMTMTGQFVGSLPWASPEQAEGAPASVDLRTDVYSLGVILYQILTKKFPYPVVGHIRTVIDNIVSADPLRPSMTTSTGSRSDDIDDDIDTIVLKCMAKEPARRYQSAADLARDLRQYLNGEPIDAKRDSGWYVLRKTMRRYRVSVAVATTILALLIGFGITMSVMFRRAEREADRARKTLTFLQDTLFAASSRRLGPDATLLQVLEKASKRAQDEFGAEPAVAAAIHYTIGDAYETVWRRQEAAQHLRTSLSLYNDTYGPNHPDTLKAMVLLGMVLGELRNPEAVTIQAEALERRRKLFGNDHVLVAESMNELAYSYWRTAIPRRWQDAERHYEEALKLYRRLLGNEHRDIARCLYAFGAMQHALGRLDKTVSLYSESLTMSRRLLGNDHQFTLECLMGYSVVLQQLGRYDDAEVMVRELLESAPRRFGAVRKPNMMRRMADLQMGRGDLSAARRWLDDSIALSLQQLIPVNPDNAEELNRLAAPFRGVPSDNALPPYREAFVSIAKHAKDKDNVAEALMSAAQLLVELNRADRAELLLRDAVELLRNLPTKNRIFTQYAANTLGDCLVTLNRFDEAEPLLLKSHDHLASELTYVHPLARSALSRIVDLYEKWNRPEKAEEYRAALRRVDRDQGLLSP